MVRFAPQSDDIISVVCPRLLPLSVGLQLWQLRNETDELLCFQQTQEHESADLHYLPSVVLLSQFSLFMNHHSGDRHVRMLLFGLLYGLGQSLQDGATAGATPREGGREGRANGAVKWKI